MFLTQVGNKSTFITGVGLWRGLDEQEGLLVRDAFLQLELDQRQDLERHERVNERLKTIDDFLVVPGNWFWRPVVDTGYRHFVSKLLDWIKSIVFREF